MVWDIVVNVLLVVLFIVVWKVFLIFRNGLYFIFGKQFKF